MRRRVVALGVLVAAVVVVWLAVRGVSDVLSTAKHGAELAELEIRSEAVRETLPVNVVVPRVPMPTRVGRCWSSCTDGPTMAAERTATSAKRCTPRWPIRATGRPSSPFPSGGEASYWHDRGDGEWGTWVTDVVIPRVAMEFDADPQRVAIGGISMGGYGAFDVERVNPRRFCAVGGHSPALSQTASETAPGAFDDAEGLRRPRRDRRRRVSARALPVGADLVDAGDEDPFQPEIQAFTAALETAGAELTAKTWPGGHTGDYWRSHWDDYMRFYSRALANC